MVLSSSTNTQLMNFAEKMKLPLNDILMRDEMNELKDDGFYIINLDDSNGNGTHWTALYYNNNPLNSYYFDSFGFVPPLEVEKKNKTISL